MCFISSAEASINNAPMIAFDICEYFSYRAMADTSQCFASVFGTNEVGPMKDIKKL